MLTRVDCRMTLPSSSTCWTGRIRELPLRGSLARPKMKLRSVPAERSSTPPTVFVPDASPSDTSGSRMTVTGSPLESIMPI